MSETTGADLERGCGLRNWVDLVVPRVVREVITPLLII